MSKFLEIHPVVLNNRFLTPTVFELELEVNLAFEAGQFISVFVPAQLPSGELKTLRRAYSIASSPDEKHLRLCIKKVPGGPGSEFLASLKPGDTFKAMAPYGDFKYQMALDKDLYFISTGTGLAPFCSMMGSHFFQTHLPRSVHCWLGVSGVSEVFYESWIQGLPFSVNWRLALSQEKKKEDSPSHHFFGRVTDCLKLQAIDWNQSEFYLCGAGAMISEVKSILLEKGVAKQSIHQEIYFKS